MGDKTPPCIAAYPSHIMRLEWISTGQALRCFRCGYIDAPLSGTTIAMTYTRLPAPPTSEASAGGEGR